LKRVLAAWAGRDGLCAGLLATEMEAVDSTFSRALHRQINLDRWY